MDRRILDEWEGESCAYWRERWKLPGLHLYGRVGSTMDIARNLAEAGAPAGTLVLAEEQTAGRGRTGRRWYSPPGAGLLMSFVLRPRAGTGAPLAPGTLPLRMGLAVAGAIEETVAIPVLIKWPNDVVGEEGRKLAGIVCEGTLSESGGFVVAGIGVNVAQREEDLPAELRGTATSLRLLTGRTVSRAPLATALIRRLSYRMETCARPLEPDAMEQLETRDVLNGQPVTIDGQPAGSADGFALDGALRVRTPDGREHHVRHGTVRIAPDAEPIRRN